MAEMTTKMEQRQSTPHPKGAVAKIIELVGNSEKGFDDAVANAVRVASETIDGINGVHVENLSAVVREGKVTEYRADVKISFAVLR